jgi:hypothetical protein
MADPAPARKAARPRRSAGSGRAAGAGGAVPGPAAGGDSGTGRPADSALDLLTRGSLEVTGRLIEASNVTLYGTLQYQGAEAACVYKPVAGERPLWDFRHGSLAGREVAAYLVSQASGWDLVPPTVYRNGPAGPGMCQLWIDADVSVDLLALACRRDHQGLRNMAVFDAVINNADRKIGHLLPVPGGHLYGCDHGVSFAEEYKLRTVLWQWRGERLAAAAVARLERLRQELDTGELAADLGQWLSSREIAATRMRIELLLRRGVYPFPPEDWPAIPWPPV